MALSFDDRILGEKTHYYCSSSEDEEDAQSNGSADEEDYSNRVGPFPPNDIEDANPPTSTYSYSGHCKNTGPKVLILKLGFVKCIL